MNHSLHPPVKGRPLLRFLGRLALAALLLFVLTAFGLAAFPQFSQQSQPTNPAPGSAASADLIAPLLDAASLTLRSADPAWQVSWRAPDTNATAISDRYPGLSDRFPDGVLLTLMDQPQAPEPLRGSYDDHPAELTVGAIYPEAVAGESVQPQAEAWAGCRRDQELGPARQLNCYLYVRGEPGDTLDGLAALAWIQALDETFSGRIQAIDRETLPFINAHKQGEQWTYDDSYLSLAPVALPASSSSP